MKRVDRLSKEEKIDLMFDLINAFKVVRNPSETALFLQDLLTASEIENLAKRLRIAKLLLSGMSHREIAVKLKCAAATVTKVNIWLNQGGDGFKNVISKLPLKWKMPEDAKGIPIEFQGPQVLAKVAKYAVATKQRKPVQKFIEKIESKKLTDKKLRKALGEYYK